MLLAVRVQLGLRVERGAEALERAEQRVDLVQRVLARCRRVHLEPERDLVCAVRNAQPDPRLRRATTPRAKGRVLDEDTHVRVTVEAGQVEADLLVDAGTPSSEGPRRVCEEVRQGALLSKSHRGICCGRGVTSRTPLY